jgi:hypothetical protein
MFMAGKFSQRTFLGLLSLACLVCAARGDAQELGPITVTRITAPIVIDGDLSDAGWQGVPALTTFFETNVGDSLPAPVANEAYLAYDDQFLYAGFRFGDDDPSQIKAPLGDHDYLQGYTDYAGLIIDPRGEAKVAQMFLANYRGVRYDAISSDATGEDSSPNFFWDALGKRTETGWTLEIRVPFSSLRYTESNPEQWSLLIYRNHPRNFRYQYFSSKISRDSNCFICNSRPMVGLRDLPSGAHWVLAPYATVGQASTPEGGLGGKLRSEDPDYEVGLDAKWIPNPNTVIDATINPDFSQIESDAPEITANERFAIFFPEKRSFFLESVDLFSSPIQAIYTRTFTSPRFGLRASGDFKGLRYTVLAGEDRGGGVVVLPGSEGSSFADQDYSSQVVMARANRTVGKVILGGLYTGREIDGGGYNRVLGPDVDWRPTTSDQIVGQLLFSRSETPVRPELAAEWDGRELSGHAGELTWYHSDRKWDWVARVRDISEGFRADNGFIPQVGYRRYYGELGHHWRPESQLYNHIRVFAYGSNEENADGRLLYRELAPSIGINGALNSFTQVDFSRNDVTIGGRIFERFQIKPQITLQPGGFFSQLVFSATLGDDTDFAQAREAQGLTYRLTVRLRPTDHLEVALTSQHRELDVKDAGGHYAQLFQTRLGRIRAVYNFNSRSWLRLIGQYAETESNPDLYTAAVTPKVGDFNGSVVFAYKLNWQTVLFLGYGDQRELDVREDLQPAANQAFFKISYAFQR